MESKSRNSYDCVIRFIKHNLVPNLTPEIIITDYETALRDVLISVFPGARSVGCWFHHNQVGDTYLMNANKYKCLYKLY